MTSSLVAVTSLPSSCLALFPNAKPSVEASSAKTAPPHHPETRTWKSCNSAIAPRQTFPLGQQHVPLTSIPTLGHALLEGKPSDIDYVNIVLQRLASSSKSVMKGESYNDAPHTERHGLRHKRKHRRGGAGRPKRFRKASLNLEPVRDDRDLPSSVFSRRHSIDATSALFSLPGAGSFTWTAPDYCRYCDSSGRSRSPETMMPDEALLPASETTTPLLAAPSDTSESCNNDYSNEEQRKPLVEAVQQEEGVKTPHLSQLVCCSQAYEPDPLAEGDSQTAAEDWLDQIFGDGTYGQDLLQDEALSELIEQ